MNSVKLLYGGAVTFIAIFLVFVAFSGDQASTSSRHLKSRMKRDVTARADSAKQQMEFDDFMNGKFRYKTFYPNWVSENEYISMKGDGSLVKVNIETDVETLFLSADAWNNRKTSSSWSVSADQLYVAIIYDATDGYAHYVRTFSFDIYEVQTGNSVPIPGIPLIGIQKLKWSTTGHSFAYVYGFNVYISTDFSVSPSQVTSNGDEQLMFNGIADWLFSVEITDDDALMWWSPDGSYLAYATIDQTDVMQFEFAVFNNLHYPEMISLPYPKPGTPIPKTNVAVVNVTSLDIVTLAPNANPAWEGFYLNSAVWRGDIFTPTWKNRIENEVISEDCMAPNFTCSHGSNMTQSSTTGWIGHYKVSHIFPTSNQNEYLTTESSNGYPHVAVHDVTGDSVDFRTSGAFEVTDVSSGYEAIHYYDDAFDWIYFTSTELESSPGEGLPRIRHLWRVKGHGADTSRTCITCQLNIDYKDRCNWVNPTFSSDGNFVVINCGGTANGVPISTLHKKNATGDYEFVKIVEDNAELQATIDAYYFREKVYGTIQLPGVDGDWYYMLLKPPNFDPNKKYPMLVQVYSGPAYQEVEDRFSVSWKDYVASSKEVVVMSFDGRGTGFRGDEIMHMVYKKLGQYEPMDQISAAKIIGQQNSFIDTTRTAIWGWSYGGYATSRTIGEDAEGIYKCGFAVAPVTKWELYHTIYTERYMLQPKDNLDGYSKGTAIQKMENFKKHRYSLFHGTRDENVHFQNSAQLSQYLIASDVDFRAFFAADDDHGMNRVPNDYRNIYKMLTRQMDICFGL